MPCMNFSEERDPRQHHAFLGEVHLDVQLVHRHPILEVSIKPVRFLDQHHADGRVRLQIGDHLAEGSASGLLSGFNVDIFLRDHEA